MTLYTEPDWTTTIKTRPEDVPDYFTNNRVTPTMITGAILRMVQAQFASADHISDPMLKNLVWVPATPGTVPANGTVPNDTDAETSPILIEAGFKLDRTQIDKLPAILVYRGPYTPQAASPMRGHQNTDVNKQGLYLGEQYTWWIEGFTRICVVDTAQMGTDRLVDEVAFRFIEYAPVMRSDLNLGNLAVVKVDTATPLDNSGRGFFANIQIAWKIWHNWTLTSTAPILKKIRMTTDTFGS